MVSLYYHLQSVLDFSLQAKLFDSVCGLILENAQSVLSSSVCTGFFSTSKAVLQCLQLGNAQSVLSSSVCTRFFSTRRRFAVFTA